ncbi:MAG: ABC transporter substrate-binding protein [Gemmatimonadota bacterium]|uniref:ABC transporter substrate-binding protein n=1 Tax=Candidatus Palauibacter scopulicola TaxID=3056741 RepID=UPI0023A61931|nr:ABC transporter substrate-binding protein [Candidatus Palauibacter scopulicola]MDE2664000.1 ABC transporter substrate-binding protein [Candidatus Palauibacter scopulicola]
MRQGSSPFHERRRAAQRRVALGCGAVLVAAAGCAFIAGNPPIETAAPNAVDAEGAAAALRLAEADYEQGRFAEAAARADSLDAAWREVEPLRPLADRALSVAGRALEAQRLPRAAADRYGLLLARAPADPLETATLERLVRVLSDTSREAEAVAAILSTPRGPETVGAEELRRLTSALTVAELRPLTETFPPETAAAAIVHAHLARLLVIEREADEARRLAARILEGQPAERERTTAEMIAGTEADLGSGNARIGAILPLTGDLSEVGHVLREGIELAVERYRDGRPSGFDVELIVLDDESDPENTAGLVRSLEGRDVIAIVGPLRSEPFAAAARARRNPRLPIISPTATEVLNPAPATYSLYDAGTRASDVAEELARWTLEELRLRRVAVLEPDGVGLGGAVGAFTRTIREYGGLLVGHERYDPGLTTFQEPIEAVAASEPDVVFAPAASASGVLAVAPQLFYYGLYNVIVVGSEAWAEPAVLRRLERFATDHRVIGLVTDRVNPGTPWQRFVTDYERRYRKTLRDNIMPALAHDATLLVLSALDGARLPIPAALAAYLESGPEIEGVTGRLRPEAERSVVRRSTEVRMLVDGAPVEADTEELLAWLAEVRAAPSPFAPRDSLRVDTLRTEARRRAGAMSIP